MLDALFSAYSEEKRPSRTFSGSSKSATTAPPASWKKWKRTALWDRRTARELIHVP
nr:hypothetical protein [Treponema endosymbiont of Eucomonympha sp.]